MSDVDFCREKINLIKFNNSNFENINNYYNLFIEQDMLIEELKLPKLISPPNLGAKEEANL